MSKKPNRRFETNVLHAGQTPDSTVGARAVPIYATAAYVLDGSDYAADLFEGKVRGYAYSRASNPTVRVLEERLAALEGGVDAVCTASGQSAVFHALAAILRTGDHVVASRSLYGDTYNTLLYVLERAGIGVTFVSPRDLDGFQKAILPETRLIFAETVGNPGLEILDIPALAKVAHAEGLPLMIDNTFATPYLCRPIEHGADIVIHSVTKWLGGHGVNLGGAIIDGGTFDWTKGRGTPSLTEPQPGHFNTVFTEKFGNAAFINFVRADGLRNIGATLAPQAAFIHLLGIETLPLRMQRHCDNAKTVAEYLQQHDAIAWVNYPGLPDHPDYALGKTLMPQGAGGMVTFGIKGGLAAGRTFIDSLQLVSHLANVGDAKSLAIMPAATTQSRMTPEARKEAGIGDDWIRLSVGLEHTDDLKDDLDRALRASQKNKASASAA